MSRIRTGAKQVREITDCKQLVPGCYYFCYPRGAEHNRSIERCGGDFDRPYIGNRIWAYEGNNQAMERWRVMGPIEFPELPNPPEQEEQ